MCDVPGYGYYSNFDEFENYRAAIVDRKNKGVKISVTVYSYEAAKRAFERQFTEPLDSLQGQALTLLDEYRVHVGDVDEKISTNEELCESLLLQNKAIRNALKSDASFDEVSSLMPVYFWIVEKQGGQEAIFSFASLRVRPKEVAFRTVDDNLIKLFERILEDVRTAEKQSTH